MVGGAREEEEGRRLFIVKSTTITTLLKAMLYLFSRALALSTLCLSSSIE